MEPISKKAGGSVLAGLYDAKLEPMKETILGSYALRMRVLYADRNSATLDIVCSGNSGSNPMSFNIKVGETIKIGDIIASCQLKKDKPEFYHNVPITDFKLNIGGISLKLISADAQSKERLIPGFLAFCNPFDQDPENLARMESFTETKKDYTALVCITFREQDLHVTLTNNYWVIMNCVVNCGADNKKESEAAP